MSSDDSSESDSDFTQLPGLRDLGIVNKMVSTIAISGEDAISIDVDGVVYRIGDNSVQLPVEKCSTHFSLSEFCLFWWVCFEGRQDLSRRWEHAQILQVGFTLHSLLL
jgi:hypothetical protein